MENVRPDVSNEAGKPSWTVSLSTLPIPAIDAHLYGGFEPSSQQARSGSGCERAEVELTRAGVILRNVLRGRGGLGVKHHRSPDSRVQQRGKTLVNRSRIQTDV